VNIGRSRDVLSLDFAPRMNSPDKGDQIPA